MSRTSGWLFGCLASVLAACAQASDPGTSVGVHDGGLPDTSRADVKPGTDTARPDEDTAPPDEDTAVGTKDTAVGSDTADAAACSIPTGKKCETWPQCGCPGKNCDVTKADGTRSCTTAGTKKLHDKCAGYNECGAGTSCIAGNCLQLCNTSPDCPSGTCTNITSGTPPVDIPGYLVCFEDCDPANPATVCGAGNCQFNGASDTVCTTAGTGTGAGGCSTSTPFSCAPGYVCLTTNACAKWCRMGFPSDCSTGPCGALTSAPKKGRVEYGVCP